MRVLKHAKIEKEIEFNESTNYYLCIENPRFYREFISDVDTKSDDSDKKVFLEENNKLLKIEKNLFLIKFSFSRSERIESTDIPCSIVTSILVSLLSIFLILNTNIPNPILNNNIIAIIPAINTFLTFILLFILLPPR